MVIDPTNLQKHPLITSFFEVVKERFRLTRRESEVLQMLLLHGASNKQLGEVFNLSEKTMKNHVSNIQRKFNAKSSRELQSIVFRDTLIPVFMNVFHTPKKQMEGTHQDVAISY
ncbi:response regulator transcription factor [Paenibacillus gansuensis]|uniref:Response regulator transcription factor n=1 Tax=Paenibacillus gansuensis TaxID=306542 RepID=A0ABW5PJ10_9BACL